MPISDELAALRALGTVRATSTALSSKESSTNYVFTTPQQQEVQRKLKSQREKAAREEAEMYLRKHNAGGLEDLLYRKLRELKARKRAGARASWKKKSDGASNEEGSEKAEEEDEDTMAVEMLPEHLVKALKAKYETENATEALNRALKEEEEGRGTYLSDVMASLDEEGAADDNAAEAEADVDDATDEVDGDEKKKDDEDLVTSGERVAHESVAEELVPTDAANEETVVDNNDPVTELADSATNLDDQEEPEETAPTSEPDSVALPTEPKGSEEVTEEEPIPEKLEVPVETGSANDEPVEEVRSKIEHLSIGDDAESTLFNQEPNGTEVPLVAADNDQVGKDHSGSGDVVIKTEITSIQEYNDSNVDVITSEAMTLSKEEQIQQTKLFYNTHSKQFVSIIDAGGETLSPSNHRNVFLDFLQMRQQDKATADSAATATFQIVDLGCGHGRDTKYFASLGHHVLAIDYAISMLDHAKTSIVPHHAHFLNMDMRMCNDLLVDDSIDGIWANASLLHLPKLEMRQILDGLYAKIKVGGVLYISLKVGESNHVGEAGEVFEADSRYQHNIEEVGAPVTLSSDGTTCKLYSYYTEKEVADMFEDMCWDVLEMEKHDHDRAMNVYVTHSWLNVFATKREK
ncbi:hypothetical protein HJC23_012279 [Cyclotella cryptica]|uniref:Methyltransferase domain-containing protein n=1 Tax=Cyclotella cryptica TaxID=29204 RepID=A0ABD3P7G7_9STRA|eukprot:CCRYP_016802-RA/>CCRYP_016802-RA protein AED:0.00 eAED:0.00 QI:221/-1/1/1/-1/1/1/588/633